MKKLTMVFHKPILVIVAAAVAFVLIFLCFLNFRGQVNHYIEEDMCARMQSITRTSVQLVQKEMDYLQDMTLSAATLLSQLGMEREEEILTALEEYVRQSNVARALFVTLDGHAYSDYAGYLGQSEDNTAIDGVPLSAITQPIFARAFYDADLDKVIFGVVAPATLGARRGVLVSSYNIVDLADQMDTQMEGDAAGVGIITREGKVVTGGEESQFDYNIFTSLRNLPFRHASAAQMEETMAAGQAGFCVYEVDGVPRYCTYAPVGQNDWYVIANVKEEALRGPLTEMEHYGLQLVVELVVIMLALLCVLLANRHREHQRVRDVLEQAARLDGLTGAFNRKATEDYIDRKLPTTADALLLLLDLDDFKKLNDRWGHLFGDTVLKACAHRLQEIFGHEGIVGRLGGDEFAVFLDKGGDLAAREAQLEDFLRRFTVADGEGEERNISLSVGLARQGPQANDFLTLYQQADDALYRAKEKGKARVER